MHPLTAFTGVSGSGKSSLIFSKIAAESQRLINETYNAFVQGFMPTMARPDVDVLNANLPDPSVPRPSVQPSRTSFRNGSRRSMNPEWDGVPRAAILDETQIPNRHLPSGRSG